MMQATEEIILVCPECRHENESERIYCHECGARLDRSKAAKLKSQEEDPKETQKRLKTMLDGRSAKRKQLFFLGAKLILGAYLVAGLIQICRPPDLPPRTSTSVAELPPQINLDLENATMDPRGAVLPYSEDQINSYLTYSLKSKQTALSQYLKFERLALGFDEGTVKVTVERSLYGYSVFTTGSYRVSLENGNVRFKNVGGQIGRLQVHPKLMEYGDIMFADLRGALERERKMLSKLAAIELHPKQVVFVAKQSQK
ncbi:MAG: zinc ribbon domain-containing protein [Verrucomicrobiota bacterium]|nr:zinc ribbon domain-containing protein [Verrucomicrobiota bacterium]